MTYSSAPVGGVESDVAMLAVSTLVAVSSVVVALEVVASSSDGLLPLVSEVQAEVDGLALASLVASSDVVRSLELALSVESLLGTVSPVECVSLVADAPFVWREWSVSVSVPERSIRLLALVSKLDAPLSPASAAPLPGDVSAPGLAEEPSQPSATTKQARLAARHVVTRAPSKIQRPIALR